MRKMNIGTKITELRKNNKWSQADLGTKVGVSREIIGRYERDDVLPSIEVAKKIADAFGVSLDYLAGEGGFASYDKETTKRLDDIQQLDQDSKTHLFAMMDAFLRDFKAKQAYK